MSKRTEYASMDLLSAYKDQVEEKDSLSLADIVFNPTQPRILNKEKVEDLIESMNRLGLIEPIVVKKDGSKFIIIAGERRFRAAVKLGWSHISARVIDANDDLCYEIALAENEKRKSLNPWEVGRAIQFLRKEKKKTASEVADLLGYTERYVKQLSSIARLDQKTVEDFLEKGREPSVKNLENLLRQKEGRGEIISPQNKYRIVINLNTLSVKKREGFLLELDKLKRKYDLN
jgi:ParB family transcriptional regulator, chromosome partitioning protein